MEGAPACKSASQANPRLGLVALALMALSSCASGKALSRSDLSEQLTGHGGAAVRAEGADTAPSLPKSVQLSDGLTSDEAVALALWNSPSFNALLSDLEVSRADLDQAGMLPNPTFALLFPLGPKQLEMWSYWDISFLWQRNGRVELSSLRAQQVAHRLMQSGLQLARDARAAHARLYAAQARAQLADEAARTWQEILRISEVRHAVQAANDVELTSVKTDARMAALTVLQLRNGATQARLELQRLLGFELPEGLQIVPDALLEALPSTEAMLKVAHGARPDLRAAELGLEASAKEAGVAARDAFRLSLGLDANGRGGANRFELGPGMQLVLPFFNLNGPAQDRAEAELQRAAYRYLEVKQAIDLDVQGAALRFGQARETLSAWPAEVVAPLSRNVELSTLAFKAGGTSHLTVLESTRRLIEAQRQQVDLELALRTAQADLALSIGRDMDAL